VIPHNDAPVRSRLAGLDRLTPTPRNDLEGIGLVPVCDEADLDILEREDPAWLLVSCKLKIVETVPLENKPPSLPRLVSSTLLQQPAYKLQVTINHSLITYNY